MGNFEQFTGLYELSKTLRFELKPVGETKKLLDESEELFPKDNRIDEVYDNIIKPYLNKLHSELIEESLKSKTANNENIILLNSLDEELYYTYKDEKKVKDYEKSKKSLRKEVVSLLENSKFEYASWYKELLDKKCIDILKNVYWDKIYEKEDESKNYLYDDLIWRRYAELIDEYFKWFTTYLVNFHENRRNLYKDDGKASRVATRTIDENLSRFFQNKLFFDYTSLKEEGENNKSYKANVKDFVETNLEDKEKEIFEVSFFNNCLNQGAIQDSNNIWSNYKDGIIYYNQVVWNINAKVNEYNQKQWLKGNLKVKKLKVLYKQILSEVWENERFSFLYDKDIKDYNSLLKAINKLQESEHKKRSTVKDAFEYLVKEQNWIYIKKWAINKLSSEFLEKWSTLSSVLFDNKKDTSKFISLELIKEKLNETKKSDVFGKDIKLYDAKDNFETFVQKIQKSIDNKLVRISKNSDIIASWIHRDDFEDIIKGKKEIFEMEEDGDTVKTTAKWILKQYLDDLMYIDQAVSYFVLEENRTSVDIQDQNTDFYSIIDDYKSEYDLFKVYNNIRNFLTKKPFDKTKTKLNFNNWTLLDWRDKNKEADNYWVLLRKNWEYFLAIMKKESNHFFDASKNPALYEVDWQSTYEKIDYKLLPWPNKQLPRVFFSKKNIDFFNPSQRILDIRKRETFKVWDNFNLDDLHAWIDFMKQSLLRHEERSNFWFKFKDTKEYDRIDKFYADVAGQWYKISFQDVSEKEINDQINLWKLYLFQIYNKDFAPKSKWNEKLHTIYWKALFEKENFENGATFKLNWKAEIFFRPKSKKQINKNDLEDTTQHLKVRNDKAIENKRYTKNKILFHCPITINFVNKRENKTNDMVKEYIKNNNMKVIGIDRGEKELLYYSIIDENQNVIDKGSLNTLVTEHPNGNKVDVPYKDKLEEKERLRDQERKSWNTIETIKELKEWYISQVVHKIVNLAIEHNAIIVLEDLNWWFKRLRQKIERQVYQKFELALAKKLNYVVSKEKWKNDLWWLYKAYQLTPKISDFQDIYIQTGILFYTQAWYTSTTCPECGFRKNIYRKYENIEKTKKFIKTLSITYEDWNYIFCYDIEATKDKHKNVLQNTHRTLTTKGQERYFYERNDKNTKWETKKHNLIEKFDELFEKHWIDKNNIVEWILALSDKEAEPFKNFMFYWNLLLQVRNSKTEENIDRIQCPSCGFNTDNSKDIPSGDANGAYNIARKWVMQLDKVRKWESIWITNIEWDNFSQTK